LALTVGLSLVAAPALAEDQRVAARDDFFDARSVTINVGDTVTWFQAGIRPHNVKFDDGSFEEPPDPSVTRWEASRRFDTPGEFRYYCEVHGARGGVGMAGTVTVLAPGQAPPPEDVPPVLSALRVRPSTGCRRRTRTCRRTRVGFEFSVSEAATVNGAVRKRGERTRRFQREAVQGENTIRFSTRGLATGRWRLTLVATDQANHTSAPARTTFRVRR
jgi:plastocyanin